MAVNEQQFQQMQVDMAVAKESQANLDRRHEQFMENIRGTVAEINDSMRGVWKEVNSIHGHITRCRDELRGEIDRDFLSNTEAEKLRGEIKAINTRINMTGAGIVLVLSLVQIAIAIWA